MHWSAEHSDERRPGRGDGKLRQTERRSLLQVGHSKFYGKDVECAGANRSRNRRRSSTTCQLHSSFNYARRYKMPSELEKFQADLLQSVKQMRLRQAARVTTVNLPSAVEARAKTGLSQQDFANLLGISARTLQDWEQGRREPTGAAKTLLRVAASHPKILLSLAR